MNSNVRALAISTGAAMLILSLGACGGKSAKSADDMTPEEHREAADEHRDTTGHSRDHGAHEEMADDHEDAAEEAEAEDTGEAEAE